MATSFLTGLLAGYALAIPVGAVAVLMVNMTARTSFRMGAAAAGGVVTADGLYAAAAVIGGSTLAVAIRPIATPLTWVAALVLLAMAVHVVHAAVSPRESAARGLTPASAGRSYGVFFGLTALNPWPAIYFGALALGRHTPIGTTIPEAVIYVVGILLASASWQLLLAAGGALLGHRIADPRTRKLTGLVSGALIGVLAIRMI